MPAKKGTKGKKKGLTEKIKSIDVMDFKPSFDALDVAVKEALEKRKADKQDGLIEEAEYQKLDDKEEKTVQQELKKIKKDISPIFGIIFQPINLYLTTKGITPFTIEDQKKIQHFTFAIIEKSIRSSIVKYSEEIAKGTSVFARIWELVDIVFNIIIPRVQEYYNIKKSELKGI